MASSASAAEVAPGHRVDFGVEAGYLSTSGHESFTEGFVGKLRNSDDGFVFGRGWADYRGRVTDTLDARIAVEAYDDDIGSVLDLTQAFLVWRPVPSSATRYRLKAGMFYPRISLENVDAGWSSRYTLNSSAINTWVAEELRATGLELSASRRFSRSHTVTASIAAFVGNDPAGSLLAWKGWSIHDRQTRPSDDIPLAPLPQIQPGMMFDAQEPYVEPILELDDKAGYYINVDWRFGSRFLLRAMHYDNRADPTVLERGQYAWGTDFTHLGLQLSLPGDVGLLAQWMDGATVMGPLMGGWHPVDVDYQASYLMLTRSFDAHRLTARYDRFEVSQNDSLPQDNNDEDGNAWTLSYQYRWSDKLRLAVEYLSIETDRAGWMYFGLQPTRTEDQTQLSVRLSF